MKLVRTPMIPKNIEKRHIIKAVEELRRSGIRKGRRPKKFLLEHDGKYFPPKYVISLANKYANGKELGLSGNLRCSYLLDKSGE